MSLLNQHLQGLMTFLEKVAHVPPTREIRIVEIDPSTSLDQNGRIRVSRSALHTPEGYEARFAELIRRGLPWINMSSLGVQGAFLIVGVEAPRGGTASRTSVNYSGPSAEVLQNGWAADSVLLLE